MAGKVKKELNLSTEEKIKAAARKVFMEKGFGASRTRDIADEAGINLALLNYYFRSKEKLFHEIMIERVQQLFGSVAPILMDESTSLEKKIELITPRYIDLLQENPDLPMFVLNEIRKQPNLFKTQINLQQILMNSSFLKQLKAIRKDIDPSHFLINLMGMMLFPFIARPIFITTGIISEKSFTSLMEQRRKLIPKWFKAILKTK
jgi:AcrR family transcriptional regulator